MNEHRAETEDRGRPAETSRGWELGISGISGVSGISGIARITRFMVVVALTVFGVGCDSNPTPHPQDPDVRNDATTGNFEDHDRDPADDSGEVQGDDTTPPWSGVEGDACGSEADGDAGPLDDGREVDVLESDAAPDGNGETDEADETDPCPGGENTDDGDGEGSGSRDNSASEPAFGGAPRPIGAKAQAPGSGDRPTGWDQARAIAN